MNRFYTDIILCIFLLAFIAESKHVASANGYNHDDFELPPTFVEEMNEMYFPNLDSMKDGFRRQILEVPDEWHENCVYWINAVRAREGLPALRRWKAFEPCTTRMAKYDYGVYNTQRRAHAGISEKKFCNFEGNQAWGQNTCPNWLKQKDTIEHCTIAMWEEKEFPGINSHNLSCKGRHSSECGHYWTLRGGEEGKGGYNRFDKVACGFYSGPKGLYINQNFGRSFGSSNFECGGDEQQKPQQNLPQDCSFRGSYTDCTGTGINYDVPGCAWTHKCDFTFKTGIDKCEDQKFCSNSHLKLSRKSCEVAKVTWNSGKIVFQREGCRKMCDQCECDPSATSDKISGGGRKYCYPGECSECKYCKESVGCVADPTHQGDGCNDGDFLTENDVCQRDGTCRGSPSSPHPHDDSSLCLENLNNNPEDNEIPKLIIGDYVKQGAYQGSPWYKNSQTDIILFYQKSHNTWVLAFASKPGNVMWYKCTTSSSGLLNCKNWQQYRGVRNGRDYWVTESLTMRSGKCSCKNRISLCPYFKDVCSAFSMKSACPKMCGTCFQFLSKSNHYTASTVNPEKLIDVDSFYHYEAPIQISLKSPKEPTNWFDKFNNTWFYGSVTVGAASILTFCIALYCCKIFNRSENMESFNLDEYYESHGYSYESHPSGSSVHPVQNSEEYSPVANGEY